MVSAARAAREPTERENVGQVLSFAPPLIARQKARPKIHLADPARGPTVKVGNHPSCSPAGRESTMKLYGGIDLHSNNSVVALLDEDELLVYRKRLPNTCCAPPPALRLPVAAAARLPTRRRRPPAVPPAPGASGASRLRTAPRPGIVGWRPPDIWAKTKRSARSWAEL